jgi:SNF2 family DNA or RNA helicase
LRDTPEEVSNVNIPFVCLKLTSNRNIEQSVKFSDAELQLYKAIETKSQVQFNKYLAKGTVNNNYANVLVMLLRLRQICCHPHLVKDLGVQVSTDGIAEDALNERAKVLSQDVVRRLQATESFECPICFEVEWNPTIFIPCGHTCCGECFEKLKSNALASHEGNDPAGAAKCPHCRAILSSDNITDYKHFCKVHCPEKLPQFGEEDVQAEGSDVDVDDDSDDDSGEDLDDDEVDDRGNLADFVVDDESDGSETVEDGSRNKSKGKGKGKARKAEGKGKGKAKAKPILSLAQLKKESLKSKSAKRKYLRRLRKNFESSAKIDQTIEILTKIKANDPTEKTLIFSQFTSLLDLLEVPMSEHDIKYQRYDGSMSMNDRADAVNNFMDDPTQNVFLISLKAGNAGLNLNTASQVIMMDPFWNPFVEDQAVDRAHRMPQKREVQVHRLLVAETVEDRYVYYHLTFDE